MRTELLEEFIVWADNKTVEAAARKCNISQSTLSKHLASLESEIGVSLVDRSDKSRLTPAGVHLYNSASDIIERLTNAITECRSIGKREEKQIVVWDPFVFSGAMKELERLMCLFRERCTEPFRFTLRNEERKTPKQAFDEGLADIALRYDPASVERVDKGDSFKGFTNYPLLEEPILLWCSKGNPLAQRDVLSPSDLRGVPIMCSMELAHPLKESISILCEQYGFQPRFYRFNPLTQASFFFDFPPECVHLFTSSLSRDGRICSRDDMKIIGFSDPCFAVRSSVVVRNDADNDVLCAFKEFLADSCKTWRRDDFSFLES